MPSKISYQIKESELSYRHYKDRWKKNIFRLMMMYMLPLLLIIFYFQFQYNNFLSDMNSHHLVSVAENQAHMLNLFLKERVINLTNLLDDPRMQIPPDDVSMKNYLAKLKKDSEAFTDIDYFDSTGNRISYVGPLNITGVQNYSKEEWFSELKQGNERFIITDIYLGLRKKPHFTIGVNRIVDGQYVVLRATLDPQKIYAYMTSVVDKNDVQVSIINKQGDYQCVSPTAGKVLESSSIVPPLDTKQGVKETEIDNEDVNYGFSWVQETNWAVIVRKVNSGTGTIWGMSIDILLFSLLIVVCLFFIIVYRARLTAINEIEKNLARSQLEQATKLASIGELASGIAHEINNPLAIIASETGLIQDFMDPQYNNGKTINDLAPQIENIREAIFRCRDITRKLLSFVRQDDISIQQHDVNGLIDEITEGFLEREMAVSNIVVTKQYADNIPLISTDGNQFKQVLLNLVNNAVDAIKPPGSIMIETSCHDEHIYIFVSDTGKGISKDEIGKIFLPFYTTKEVGKGTGLGLSVSYSIIKGLGGRMEVESIPGSGTTFTIKLPVESKPKQSNGYL